MADHYLVTGGMGFIGSHIVRRLVGEGARVRIVDDLSTGSIERLRDMHGAFEFVEGDLAAEGVSDQVTKRVDYVLHQAAIPSVQRSVSDPIRTNRANVTATLNLLEACRKAKVRRIVCAASSSAYGDTAVLPKIESMPPAPLSPYALQKLVVERYCKLYYNLYGLETVCLRYFNVFGPGQDPHSEYSAVIPRFTTSLIERKPITIFGDGEQSRDFTYVENVVEANLLALEGREAAGRVANVGCGERITLNDLVRKLEELTGIKANVIYASPKSGDVRHSLADISLARELFGYQPRVMVMEGLRKTLATLVTS